MAGNGFAGEENEGAAEEGGGGGEGIFPELPKEVFWGRGGEGCGRRQQGKRGNLPQGADAGF